MVVVSRVIQKAGKLPGRKPLADQDTLLVLTHENRGEDTMDVIVGFQPKPRHAVSNIRKDSRSSSIHVQLRRKSCYKPTSNMVDWSS